ncbi:hypothetical protein LCY76_05085 [Fictibacillus sp. KIGAM418]|uniref:Uncharacterized protein n=1 Tax=Fictibacillus marinisediminis TaxID=2878389 RepID=A0A9X1X8R3_9BACL|nr:hypothetical protein [Fictibacillus marinisediminis]MCK6255978.1 hypothetical protein [Fictibacillus marinisediminis]
MAKKKAKKISKYDQAVNKYAHTLKMVTSSTCLSCKTQCARGLAYIDKMSKPGAVGQGVPCHLTKGKGMK